jgi:hypothetical protein
VIVRTGARIIDYGPTPAATRAKGAISGSIVVPGPTKHHSTPTPEQVARSNAQRATTRAGRRAK